MKWTNLNFDFLLYFLKKKKDIPLNLQTAYNNKVALWDEFVSKDHQKGIV